MMSSSNHVLLISDDDNVKTRKTSTSSSLDSWEGLGLDDQLYGSNPHSSRSRPRSSQNIKVLPKYDSHSTQDYTRHVLVQRGVQPQTYIPRNVQPIIKQCNENRSVDGGVSQLINNTRPVRKSTTEQIIWTAGSSAPEERGVFRPSVQNVIQSRTFAPAAHLFKAEPVIKNKAISPSYPQKTDPKVSQDFPMKVLQNCPQQAQVDQTEKMKVKLISAWNNMKYGWSVRAKSSFSMSSPICFLGVTYGGQHNGDHHRQLGESSYEKFLLDFSSRIWLTYRRDFPVLENSSLTTDCGWGCMLRSGQMMLAQALLTHILGRSWRLSGVPQTELSECKHRMILRWFGDLPSSLCPFSLHNLVSVGRSMGKKAGDWYGPANVAYILKQAVEAAAHEHPSIDELCVYVAQDCTVYKQDIIELCTQPSRIQKFHDLNVIRNSPLPSPCKRKLPVALNYPGPVSDDEKLNYLYQCDVQSSEQYVIRGFQCPPKSPISRTWSNPYLNSIDTSSPLPSMGQSSFPSGSSLECVAETRDRWRALVVLVPVRLGGDRFNKIYFPCIYRLLAHECSIGIIGGRPRHSLYFVGYQDDKLINLDPHYCQEKVDVKLPNFPVDSFQCTDPRKIPISKMDPSCTIGFYMRTREDFEKFTETVQPLLSSGDGKSDYPVFIISPESSSTSYHRPSGTEYDRNVDGPHNEDITDLDGDDFVLI